MATGQFVPEGAVDRPRLNSRLDGILSARVGLLVAQAGAGKSVLLSQWVRSHPEVTSVWVDVVPDDNDPIHFIRRLLAGLSALVADISELAPLALLSGGGLGEPLIEGLAIRLTEARQSVIVFDDVHLLSNHRLISDLESLADALPPHVHLIFASRADLPIALTHSRARGQLIELRGADLSLSTGEATQLLATISEREIDPVRMDALVARTEGWAAGLQLAGITLRWHADPDRFIDQFSGSDRLVADYLSGEVLETLSPLRRQMLLKIAVLDELSRDLVSFMVDDPYAGVLVDELERQSMFLVPIDDRREWFRFHHLFRDLLRFQLRATDSAAERVLLIRAAEWHLGRGEVNRALDYEIRAARWHEAVELILTYGPGIFERGEMATLIHWIERLPDATREGNVRLQLLHGMLEAISGHLTRGEGIIARLIANPQLTPGEFVSAQGILASLVQWRPHPEQSREIALRTLEALASCDRETVPNILGLTDPRSLETVATISVGRAAFLSGDLAVARPWLERSLRTDGAQYPVWRAHALGSLALLEAWSGRSQLANQLAAESLIAASEVGLLSHPATGDAYLALALTAIERGDPGNASNALHEGDLRATANGRTQLSWIAHVEHALLEASRNLPLRPLEAAGTDEPVGQPPPIVEERLIAMRARLLRLNGSPQLALRVARDSKTHSPAALFEQAASALTVGDVSAAGQCIAQLAAAPDALEPLPTLMRIIMESSLAAQRGDDRQGRALLGEALEIGELNGLVEVFVRAGPDVISRIATLPGPRTAFASRVIQRALELREGSPTSDLPMDLTAREKEILQYLPTRLTSAEIAAKSFISTNTVKTHTAHIYRKLEVTDRDDAIKRAKELGLL